MTDAQALFDALKAEFGGAMLGLEGKGDDAVVSVSLEKAHEVLAWLKAKKGFNVLVDFTAVDWLPKAPRFELDWRLMSVDLQTGLNLGRVAIQAQAAEGQAVPCSAADLWPCADWLEREVWDMFGIPFADRPGIKRMLMYEEFVGHPLRKDYPIKKRQPLVGPASGERPDNPSFNAQVPTITAD